MQNKMQATLISLRRISLMLIGVMIKRQGTLGIFKTVKLKLDPSVFAPFPFITFSELSSNYLPLQRVVVEAD